MKKTIIHLLFVLFLIPIATQAKVWRVNNNPGVVADFPNLEEAMSNNFRQAGDIIHLEPSVNPYLVVAGTFSENDKYVTIIGNGYDHYSGEGFQQDILQSMIYVAFGDILVSTKIKFTGVKFNSSIALQNFSGPPNISDVTFESCLITEDIHLTGDTEPDQINGLHLLKNHILGGLNITFSSDPSNILYDFISENNIIYQSLSITNIPANHDPIVIRNNVFSGNGNSFVCHDAYWANNIFDINSDLPDFTGCILKNNIFSRSSFATGASAEANNQFDIDMQTVFKPNDNLAMLYNLYELLNGSPAIGAGVPNGATPVDCGVYGGPNPFKIFGMPSIPSIYELNVPPTVTSGTDMHIGLKSRSNN